LGHEHSARKEEQGVWAGGTTVRSEKEASDGNKA